MYKIRFNFEEEGRETMTLENAEDGRSILEIALENNILLRHNCGGVCACSTCHLYIEKGGELIEEKSIKEEHFINRALNPRLSSRLGCQCLLLKGSGDLIVTLPDQTRV
jgi:2Fe-2S ferredoxin